MSPGGGSWRQAGRRLRRRSARQCSTLSWTCGTAAVAAQGVGAQRNPGGGCQQQLGGQGLWRCSEGEPGQRQPGGVRWHLLDEAGGVGHVEADAGACRLHIGVIVAGRQDPIGVLLLVSDLEGRQGQGRGRRDVRQRVRGGWAARSPFRLSPPSLAPPPAPAAVQSSCAARRAVTPPALNHKPYTPTHLCVDAGLEACTAPTPAPAGIPMQRQGWLVGTTGGVWPRDQCHPGASHGTSTPPHVARRIGEHH